MSWYFWYNFTRFQICKCAGSIRKLQQDQLYLTIQHHKCHEETPKVQLVQSTHLRAGRSLTCIRASGRLMEKASLSLMPTSGYCVCWKAFSRACSCDTVKAVRLRRCFCWLPNRASRISSGKRETHNMSSPKYVVSQRITPAWYFEITLPGSWMAELSIVKSFRLAHRVNFKMRGGKEICYFLPHSYFVCLTFTDNLTRGLFEGAFHSRLTYRTT